MVIDARMPMEHRQARIPNSVLHNREDGVGSNGSVIASEEDLKKELVSKGITPNKAIVCYRHSGTLASHKYIQFENAAYNKV